MPGRAERNASLRPVAGRAPASALLHPTSGCIHIQAPLVAHLRRSPGSPPIADPLRSPTPQADYNGTVTGEASLSVNNSGKATVCFEDFAVTSAKYSLTQVR